jgi:hypothetical protein
VTSTLSSANGIVGVTVGVALGTAVLAAVVAVVVFFRRRRRRQINRSRVDKNRAALELPSFASGLAIEGIQMEGGAAGVTASTADMLAAGAYGSSQPDVRADTAPTTGDQGGAETADQDTWMGAFSSFNIALDDTAAFGTTDRATGQDDPGLNMAAGGGAAGMRHE